MDKKSDIMQDYFKENKDKFDLSEETKRKLDIMEDIYKNWNKDEDEVEDKKDMVGKIARIANRLDSMELFKEADVLDKMANVISEEL